MCEKHLQTKNLIWFYIPSTYVGVNGSSMCPDANPKMLGGGLSGVGAKRLSGPRFIFSSSGMCSGDTNAS